MAIDTGTALIIFAGLIIMMLAFLAFFIMGILSRSTTLKIFFLSFSALLIITLMGMMVSLLQNEVTGFANYLSSYNSIYTLFIYLAGAGGAGLILWLIYYALTEFNKSRGRIPDD